MRYYEASSVIASSPEAVWAGLAVDAGSRTIVSIRFARGPKCRAETGR